MLDSQVRLFLVLLRVLVPLLLPLPVLSCLFFATNALVCRHSSIGIKWHFILYFDTNCTRITIRYLFRVSDTWTVSCQEVGHSERALCYGSNPILYHLFHILQDLTLYLYEMGLHSVCSEFPSKALLACVPLNPCLSVSLWLLI